MNITCHKCHSSVSETALVCPVCGHDFMPAPPPPASASAVGGATPFGPGVFGAPGAAPPAAPKSGESDMVLAVVCAAAGLFLCVPLSLPGLYFGLRARARAVEQGRSTTAGTAAIVVSLFACVVWAFAFIHFQKLYFPTHRAE